MIYIGERRWSAPLDALSLFTREGMPIPEPFRELKHTPAARWFDYCLKGERIPRKVRP